MKRFIICAFLLFFSIAVFPQTKIYKVDDKTFTWQKGVNLVIMKVAFVKGDTIAKYHFYTIQDQDSSSYAINKNTYHIKNPNQNSADPNWYKWVKTDVKKHFSYGKFIKMLNKPGYYTN